MKKFKIEFTRYDIEDMLSALNKGEELYDTWTVKSEDNEEVQLEITIEQ
jgi:VCBS repeat-containing protein|tara:strand:+ start:57 stop:203 length:147 start_codon:yes stop_codon:yes gene_type:complete